MNILVTGAAGFIGSQVVDKLLTMGHTVRGIDCFADYYPRILKQGNISAALADPGFELIEQDLLQAPMDQLLAGIDAAIHLSAQAGVRRSWGDDFEVYTANNILATQRLLEGAKAVGLGRLVYAGSSSVYGDTDDLPMRETSVCRPVSPYGVSKLAAEHLCRLYHTNFGLNTVSLRYFTVYGPRQRPDMAFHRFIRALMEGGTIRLFGDGEQTRDFTFVGDIVQATVDAALSSMAAGEVFNLGGGSRVSVNQVIERLEQLVGQKAKVERQKVAKGDVRHTEADTSRARQVLGFAPHTNLDQGLAAEVGWVRENLATLQEAVDVA